MNFGEAIEAMKNGKFVTRKGWNGKNMYLWYMPHATIKAEWCKEPHLKALADANGGEVECLGSIRMKTADNKVLTGWLASQTDMLSDDWEICEPSVGNIENKDDWNYKGFRYFHADVSPVSFEDGEVDGVDDDEDEPRIPCVDEDLRWRILIDMKDGKILNWKEGTTASVYYKVVDDGIYTLYDNDMNEKYSSEDYVPKIMAFDEDGFGYGDYMSLTIDEHGYIKGWPKKNIGWFIDDFVNG